MKKFIQESKRIIQKSSYNNKLVFFVGSGASYDAGLPSWTALIDEIKRKVNISNDDDNKLKIPQYFYNSRGEKEYYEFLNEKFNVDAEPYKVHDLIIDFNPCHIITTNYDELLEKAAIKKGAFYDVVAKDSDLPYTPSGKMIIKMHGDLKNRNIVLKEDDYLSYSNNFKLIENFIKSLFATKTIVFVGYSFSDENVKIIFQWIRDLLGKDSPRPYFINLDNDKAEIDINEFEYYKNRGLNVLYYSEFVKIVGDKYKTNNKTERLCYMLEYLLDKNPINKVEYVYNFIDNFKDINVLNDKVLINFLQLLGFYNFTDYEIKLNSIYIKNKDLYDFCKMFMKELKTLKKDKNTEKLYNKKKRNIYDFLCKFGIDVIYFDDIKSNKIKKLYKNIFFSKDEKRIKYINNYEIHKIEEFVNNKVTFKDFMYAQNIDMYFERAYFLYKLNKLEDAYLEFKKISEFCLKNKNYVTYVLSEFNRFYIGKEICNGWHYTKELKENIKSEIDNIKLDKILINLPLEVYQIEFLNNIISWSFLGENMQDLIDANKEIEKQEKMIFFGMTDKSRIGIYKLKYKIKRLLVFLQENYLVIDKYKEVYLIFYNYIDEILKKYTIPKMEENITNSFFENYGNKHYIDHITSFDIEIMLSYLSLREIKELFNKYKISQLNVFNDDIKKLIKILNNSVLNYNKKGNNIHKIYYILSKIKLNNEQYIDVCNLIIEWFKKDINLDYYIEEIKSLNSFIYNQGKNLKNYDRENNIIILNFVLDTFINSNDFNENLKNILLNIVSGIRTYDKKYKLKLEEKLDKLIYKSENKKQLLEIMIEIYPIVINEEKRKIKNKIQEYLNDYKKFDYKDFNIYYGAIFKNIIKQTKRNEEKIENLLKNSYELEKNGVYGFSNKEILSKVTNLSLSNKILNKERFKSYIEKDKKLEFLYNLDNYKKNDFDLKWLLDFNDKLLIYLAENEFVNKMIREQIREKYQNEEYVNPDIIKIFIKYFLD